MTLIKESVDVCSLQLHRLTILIILDLLHFIHLKQQQQQKNQFCALGQGNLSFLNECSHKVIIFQKFGHF